MTVFKPVIILKRLQVVSQARVVFDQEFQEGTNIIRSDGNTAGKSTVMEFIYYVMGGDIKEWNEAEHRVDEVFAEFSINDKAVTFRRLKLLDSSNPVSIFEDTLVNATKAVQGWATYGLKRSNDRKSFSQIIFEYMGFPEFKAATDDNVTFNQVLRLIYCDQITAVNRLYRDFPFDLEAMRKAIVELLLGVDGFELLRLRLDLRHAEKTSHELRGQVKSLTEAIGEIYKVEGFDPLASEQDIQRIKKEMVQLEYEIKQILDGNKRLTKNFEKEYRALEVELTELKQEVSKLEEDKVILIFEIEDSLNFLKSLEMRKEALKASSTVKDYIGAVSFKFCPLCLEPITHEDVSNSCSLCKTSYVEDSKNFGWFKVSNELDYQINESRKLMEIRKTSLEDIGSELKLKKLKRNRLQKEFDRFNNHPSFVDATVRNMLSKVGYKERQIEGIIRDQELYKVLQLRIGEHVVADGKVTRIEGELLALEKSREEKWGILLSKLSHYVRDFLKRDGDYEEIFSNPEEVEIDFEKNRVSVNGQFKFSASSQVVLKNSVFLALLKLSMEDQSIRYPRFLILDNIEDKGMTPARSQNFQKLIVELSESSKTKHQIIFSTSMIDPSLDNQVYCRGPKYSKQNKTLNFDL